MLSSTYTIEDIKSRLKKTYDFYGYESEGDFEDDLETVVEDVMLLYFYPRIGKDRYDEIAAKDKTGIDYDTDPEELYLYWAEVWTVCYEFNKFITRTDNQQQTSSKENLKVEGYSYESDSGDSSSLGELATSDFWKKALKYWKRAGFNLGGLQRTCTIFGDDDNYLNNLKTIIE
jgi:hypothetical protein